MIFWLPSLWLHLHICYNTWYFPQFSEILSSFFPFCSLFLTFFILNSFYLNIFKITDLYLFCNVRSALDITHWYVPLYSIAFNSWNSIQSFFRSSLSLVFMLIFFSFSSLSIWSIKIHIFNYLSTRWTRSICSFISGSVFKDWFFFSFQVICFFFLLLHVSINCLRNARQCYMFLQGRFGCIFQEYCTLFWQASEFLEAKSNPIKSCSTLLLERVEQSLLKNSFI